MSEGISKLEQTINNFERLLEEMREESRISHAVLKDLRAAERDIRKMLTTDVKKMVHDEVSKLVGEELEKIGPELAQQTSRIYDRVGREVDKIISLSLGREFSTTPTKQDLRPQLAAKLREWLDEVVWEK